jgi:hypothetical protein
MIAAMEAIYIPISTGELIDKITILRIKSKKIADPTKLANVRKELEFLNAVCQKAHIDLDHPLISELEEKNSKLWVIEDDIRAKEKAKEFDDEFIELARAVYKSNDERFLVKNKINKTLGSEFFEEKSYQEF